MDPREDGIIEEEIGAFVVDGQRCEVAVRSQPDESGTWHNALLFRRAGRLSHREVVMTGLEWHVPPGIALQRARELNEQEQMALLERALRPRQPLL
jgi:hypothetical protein